jgi:hypothetical protein
MRDGLTTQKERKTRHESLFLLLDAMNDLPQGEGVSFAEQRGVRGTGFF